MAKKDRVTLEREVRRLKAVLRKRQAADDQEVFHCGVLMAALSSLIRSGRISGIEPDEEAMDKLFLVFLEADRLTDEAHEADLVGGSTQTLKDIQEMDAMLERIYGAKFGPPGA